MSEPLKYYGTDKVDNLPINDSKLREPVGSKIGELQPIVEGEKPSLVASYNLSDYWNRFTEWIKPILMDVTAKVIKSMIPNWVKYLIILIIVAGITLYIFKMLL